ncbi:hypothetical protein EV356DRAFT_164285 [Viridothelium virens]|uniref:Uncharacterized protein n=1 Tax=Viridothelium virens TaxID=1048519 RepID=A0A6A6HMU2_VIRVR|nr:hypothetical protein EV356DRAFT_164285 [Viridothelium virens]
MKLSVAGTSSATIISNIYASTDYCSSLGTISSSNLPYGDWGVPQQVIDTMLPQFNCYDHVGPC